MEAAKEMKKTAFREELIYPNFGAPQVRVWDESDNLMATYNAHFLAKQWMIMIKEDFFAKYNFHWSPPLGLINEARAKYKM